MAFTMQDAYHAHLARQYFPDIDDNESYVIMQHLSGKFSAPQFQDTSIVVDALRKRYTAIFDEIPERLGYKPSEMVEAIITPVSHLEVLCVLADRFGFTWAYTVGDAMDLLVELAMTNEWCEDDRHNQLFGGGRADEIVPSLTNQMNRYGIERFLEP